MYRWSGTGNPQQMPLSPNYLSGSNQKLQDKKSQLRIENAVCAKKCPIQASACLRTEKFVVNCTFVKERGTIWSYL